MNFRNISYNLIQKLAIEQIKVLGTYDPGQDVADSFDFTDDPKIAAE